MPVPAALPHKPHHSPRAWRRWFAFLGGGIAWTLHLLSLYAIGEFGCVSEVDQIMLLGVSAVAWMLIAVSVLLLAVAVAAVVVGHRDAGRDGSASDHRGDEAVGGEYLSRFGRVFSVLFALIIVIESVPIFFYLGGC